MHWDGYLQTIHDIHILTLLTLKLKIFHDRWVNTVTADALAPCVTRPSAATMLIV